MRALILGRPGHQRARLHQLLVDADISIDACHDHDWGCVGMDAECPLDGVTVDVAVAVTDPADRFDAQGIACVHRARIPIVTIGATPFDPVLRYSTTNVADVDDSIVAVIRETAADASDHRRVVETSLAARLSAEEHVAVSVRRSSDAIDVELRGNIDGSRAAALADAARAAVRTHDPHAAVIDVSVIHSPAPPPAHPSSLR